MSRHRLIQPEIFKSSQFRIRTPKQDKQAFKNYKRIHLPVFLHNNNEFQTCGYKQENYRYEQENHSYEHENHGYERENYDYEQGYRWENYGNKQENYSYEHENYNYEQENHYLYEQDNYESEQNNYIHEFEQEFESNSDSDFMINNDPKIFDRKKDFFMNKNNSEFGPFNSFTIMSFFV